MGNSTGLAPLARMVYPGRAIVVGQLATGEPVAAYAITGRSASSQARRLVIAADGSVETRPTDEAILRQGNPALLVYPAALRANGRIAVSNGAQTALVAEALSADPAGELTPMETLARAFRAPRLVEGIDVRSYEPDEPNWTPRITACIDGGNGSAALAIAKRSDAGATLLSIHSVPLAPGYGWLISVYRGDNANPLPSFPGDPIPVELGMASVEALATAVYAALEPGAGQPDFRVAALAIGRSGQPAVINRHA